ncbi:MULTISPECIES: DUF2179 domain-containing protein [Carnobacterium]|uniref:UPF0316 protein Q783_07455 n=2 Tax=Carnobacterium inhibens TaxID=147709 RepID=U5SAD2_9LACT|nr:MULTISPECIES: DUF2179 domain-containing protein [Carnobacterium]AGY82031.1 membrane protein [Carnobacterium inhibens subsp. gilichinskyi]MBC9825841.1 DUF2179 domain-containing protein [Carnobacterium inhibens]MCM3511482.1 DUF2179 domain-containing protein [Carnobacterium inhibens]MDN5371418.1 hypothetical protein [Carnobacterium sp.]
MEVDLPFLLLIFIINVVYISLNTIRFMLTMKSYRLAASLVSMVEVTIYVVGLGLVLDSLDNYINLAVYALGYGVGIALGIKIEEFLALGYIMVTAIVPNVETKMPEELRDLGYGVTTSLAFGREGDRMVLEILTPRKTERKLYKQISEIEPKTFIISYEPKYINGGFWTRKVKKRRKEIRDEEQMN